MAAIPLQRVGAGLANVSFAAANSGGDTVAGGTRSGGWALPVVLLVRNADATSTTVTVNGVPVVVAATQTAAIRAEAGYRYGRALAVTYSKVTSLTVAALDLAG